MAGVTVLDENGKIRLELETEADRATVRPVGVIDEDVNFSVVVDAIGRLKGMAKVLQFDLGHVTRMNSCGVREWILLMERLGKLVPCAFLNVNELFVEQANMIPGIFGKTGTPVVSFQAPYHCEKCNSTVHVLIQPREVLFPGDVPRAPAYDCKQCGGKLAFDWIEEEYFGFIKRL